MRDHIRREGVDREPGCYNLERGRQGGREVGGQGGRGDLATWKEVG